MLLELFKNPVLLSVAILLLLSIFRLNVLFALVISALAGGLLGGMESKAVIQAFYKGLAPGALLAINYAVLGAFSIAISRSGITEALAQLLFKRLGKEVTDRGILYFKYTLLGILTLAAIFSQNLIPVHIAFIPILIPPLLPVFARLKLDRRVVACILTFGLITPYMVLPFGFGQIYLNNVLIGSINASGLKVSAEMAPPAMVIPALGMVAGLLIAIFISYRKKREYPELALENAGTAPQKTAAAPASPPEKVEISPRKLITGVVAIAVGFLIQLFVEDSLMLASLAGIAVFVVAREISLRDTQDVFTKGVYLMGGIGIIMIGASGFAAVMKATGGVETLVNIVSTGLGDNKVLASFLMLLIGLIITMGIGSSFSTVPLIAAIYVPLCIKMGFSPAATICIVGVAGALGDAGSPVSESVLGPTAGLNADGKHDHIYDTTIPTFIHFNIPLLLAGWLASLIL